MNPKLSKDNTTMSLSMPTLKRQTNDISHNLNNPDPVPVPIHVHIPIPVKPVLNPKLGNPNDCGLSLQMPEETQEEEEEEPKFGEFKIVINKYKPGEPLRHEDLELLAKGVLIKNIEIN